jgi:hypothetical protein
VSEDNRDQRGGHPFRKSDATCGCCDAFKAPSKSINRRRRNRAAAKHERRAEEPR